MATDLVCGMEVEPEKAAATSDYKGQKYYFCAQGCKEKFDADPGKYLPEPQPPKRGLWARMFKS
jgi:P-type Cu+ transporter